MYLPADFLILFFSHLNSLRTYLDRRLTHTQAQKHTTSHQTVIFPSAMVSAWGRRTGTNTLIGWLALNENSIGLLACASEYEGDFFDKESVHFEASWLHYPDCSWSTDHFIWSLWLNKKTWFVSKPTGMLQWRDKDTCRRPFDLNDSWTLNIWYCWECKVVKISGNAHCMQPSC